MLPTLAGRVQTRVALLAVIGGLVTALICPVLPVSAPLADRYQNGFVVLAAVAVLGVGWELLYHFLMQWRWEKDWPTLFGLVTLAPEGLLLWLLLSAGVIPGITGTVTAPAFAVQFLAVWLAVWLVANGPMRVPFIRWRFPGREAGVSGEVHRPGLWPVPGDGVLAREGDLVLLGSIADADFADSLVALLAVVADAGDDGRQLAGAVEEAVARSVNLAGGRGRAEPGQSSRSARSGSGLVLAVCGAAWADIATADGVQRLVSVHQGVQLRCVVSGPVTEVQAGLGSDRGGGAPHRPVFASGPRRHPRGGVDLHTRAPSWA